MTPSGALAREFEMTAVENAPRPLKIAMVSYSLPRPGFKRGGIERVAHDLAQGLSARGHDVTVLSHDPRPQGASYDVRPLPWRRFVESWLGRRLTMGYLGHVLSAIADLGDADVVIAHGDSLLLPLRRRPVIRLMHGSALDEAMTATSIGRRVLQSGVYVLELLSAMTPQRMIAVSRNTTQSNPLVREVIVNGVDRSIFRPVPGEPRSVPLVLSVGALGGRKRGDWLRRLFLERIKPRVPHAELHLVMPGVGRGDGVYFHQGLTDQALAALYRRAWVYASASTYEGFGLPYVEAMACGTPVVATPNPGSREVLADGKYGRLVDDDAFADTVVALLGDEAARQEMAKRGLARADEYSLDGTIAGYERLARSLVTHG